jgi:hypothetical protein
MENVYSEKLLEACVFYFFYTGSCGWIITFGEQFSLIYIFYVKLSRYNIKVSHLHYAIVNSL